MFPVFSASILPILQLFQLAIDIRALVFPLVVLVEDLRLGLGTLQRGKENRLFPAIPPDSLGFPSLPDRINGLIT